MSAVDAREVLTLEQVADELQMSVRWVRQQVTTGRLGCVNFGRGARRVRRDQLDAFVDACAEPASALEVSASTVEEVGGVDPDPAPGVRFIADGLTGRSRAAGGWTR